MIKSSQFSACHELRTTPSHKFQELPDKLTTSPQPTPTEAQSLTMRTPFRGLEV